MDVDGNADGAVVAAALATDDECDADDQNNFQKNVFADSFCNGKRTERERNKRINKYNALLLAAILFNIMIIVQCAMS